MASGSGVPFGRDGEQHPDKEGKARREEHQAGPPAAADRTASAGHGAPGNPPGSAIQQTPKKSRNDCCEDGGLSGCGCLTALTWRLACLVAACLLAPTRDGIRARLLRAVHRYRTEVSPTRPPCCRYTPTCSTYAVTALERHGALRGGMLTVRRLRRCRPEHAAGADPVPD